MKVLAYKTFKNNDDFVEWQKEKERKISMVSPIVNNANITSGSGSSGSVDGLTFGCFVLHFEES